MAHRFTYTHLSASPWRYARAFVQSLAAVFFVAAGAGFFFLPAQLARMQSLPDIAVMACQGACQGQMAVMLVKDRSLDPADGTRRRMLLHDLDQDVTASVRFDQVLQPACFAITRDRRSLYVADELLGTIYGVDLGGSGRTDVIIGRHVRGTPHSIICSSDERTLVSLGSEGIYAWDLNKWRLRWLRHDEKPACAVIPSDSRTLICYTTESRPGQLKEIDLETGKILGHIPHGMCGIDSLAASPDGRFVVGVAATGDVMVLERTKGEQHWRHRRIDGLRAGRVHVSPDFSPQSNLLVLGNEDGRRLTVWDLERGVPLCELGESHGPILGGAFLDQQKLLSWDSDGSLCIWDLTQRSTVKRIAIPPGNRVRS
jgi:hypothetical protein